MLNFPYHYYGDRYLNYCRKHKVQPNSAILCSLSKVSFNLLPVVCCYSVKLHLARLRFLIIYGYWTKSSSEEGIVRDCCSGFVVRRQKCLSIYCLFQQLMDDPLGMSSGSAHICRIADTLCYPMSYLSLRFPIRVLGIRCGMTLEPSFRTKST